MDLPFISVAIITYNQKVFLKECIESILNQDYPNFEIIVADDCSQDGTKEMLLEYDKMYPNRFVLKIAEKNQGITKNSNVAHFACRGKYIAWMGGDDLMLPGKLSKQVRFMEANKDCYVSYHNLEVFESDSLKKMYLMNNDANAFEGGFKEIVKYGSFNGACSTMVRRDKTPKDGFDERVPIASDWLYWMETIGSGGKIMYVNEVLGKYRRHDNNVTRHNGSLKNHIDHLNSCNILMTKYPHFSREILERYFEILRSLRLYDSPNYIFWLKASLIVSLKYKSLISILIYYFTFGRKKL